MNPNRQKTIKIAGAGPSGLTAAICLAKAGYPVDVYESRDRVGGRFIGDFQVIENAGFQEDVLEMLDAMGIKTNFFLKPVSQAVLYDYRLRSQKVSSRRPFGYFILRGSEEGDLDKGLLEQAESAGAKIHFQNRIKKEAVDLVATGPAVADGLAKEMTFSTDLPDTVSVLFDMNLSPGGYSYLFVLEGRATFGCAITKDFDGIKTYFNQTLARFQSISPFAIHSPKYGYSYMNFCLKTSAINQKKAYIGEAGGFQDYLFGLGIRYAMKTGFIAAQSILKDKSYDELWKKEVAQNQETSLVNRALYEIGGNRGLSSFVKRAGRNDFQTYLKKWHRTSSWKRIILPWVKRFWKKESSCFHRIPEHWCREKPVSTVQTSLGPVKEKQDPSKMTATQ